MIGSRIGTMGVIVMLGLHYALPSAGAGERGLRPSVQGTGRRTAAETGALHSYTLSHDGSVESYDEALAVAAIQGIVNRKAPALYIFSGKNPRPRYWLDLLSRDGRWLEGRAFAPLRDLTSLVEWAGERIKGAVIWDPSVPASVNAATTLAGVLDAVILSPPQAERYLPQWRLPVLRDLRGMFTGVETGSRKNDAVRWTIRETLAKGRCSSRLLCLYEDSHRVRDAGDLKYVVTRDWAVKNRAFVFDLSPWGDEKPGDDPEQPMGLDLETYRTVLAETYRRSAGRHMTELVGFFNFEKYSNVPGHASRHDPVPTEWESVWLMSPFNCFQNTVASDCYNQSFHSHAPRQRLRQPHAANRRRAAKSLPLEKKTYVSILMADYDSSTPLYEFLPNHWHNEARGALPLAWGINPNLLDSYPDLIAYFYETATPADIFTSDASAAGYMNPNRISSEDLPMFTRHNRRYFREAGMTIAPMVLDWDQPSPEVKDSFTRFAPDGFATIVMDLHGKGGTGPEPHLWKGMPVTNLINDACNFAGPEETARMMEGAIRREGAAAPSFHLFRVVWVNPANIRDTLEVLRRRCPDLDIELLDPHAFFALLKRRLATM